MPDQLKEFVRQSIDNLLQKLPKEELRKRLSVEERLEGLSAEEVIRGLPRETLEALARQLMANGHSSKPHESGSGKICAWIPQHKYQGRKTIIPV